MQPEVASAGSASSARPLPRPTFEVGACVVIAEFEVRATALEDFYTLARGFAQRCLDHEAGCLQFDVVRIGSTPNCVLFYEVYLDTAAFEVHCASAHLARFKAAFAPLIVGERALRRGCT